MNLAHNLERSAIHFPNRVAVADGISEISYSEFNQEASRIASALVSIGVRPGDNVALCAPNSFEWLAFYFGILKAGAAAVSVSHQLTPNELGHLCDCRPKVLFTTGAKLADVGDCGDHPYLSNRREPGVKRDGNNR